MAKVTKAITPAALDGLRAGKMSDPQNPGLSIEASCGRLVWKYVRRIAKNGGILRLTLGSYPAHSIADARKWAMGLNQKVERGEDPREETRAKKRLAALTVDFAHGCYMEEIEAGARKKLKARSIADKRGIYTRDIQPAIGSRSIHDITKDDLWKLVEAKGDTATVRANRLAAEIKVFWKWCLSRSGERAGINLATDASATLSGKHYAESAGRERYLSDEEIGILFRALAEHVDGQFATDHRLWCLLLLTGARIDELKSAPSSEYRDGVWTIVGERAKNGSKHVVPLGPWGRSLMAVKGDWIIPDDEGAGPRVNGWYNVRTRLHARMEAISERRIEHWTPHDLRRTLRSNTFRLGIHYETAEKMINHVKRGLERRYDVGDMTDYVADAFAKWENHLVEIARKAGVADKLGCPTILPATEANPQPLAA